MEFHPGLIHEQAHISESWTQDMQITNQGGNTLILLTVDAVRSTWALTISKFSEIKITVQMTGKDFTVDRNAVGNLTPISRCPNATTLPTHNRLTPALRVRLQAGHPASPPPTRAADHAMWIQWPSHPWCPWMYGHAAPFKCEGCQSHKLPGFQSCCLWWVEAWNSRASLAQFVPNFRCALASGESALVQSFCRWNGRSFWSILKITEVIRIAFSSLLTVCFCFCFLFFVWRKCTVANLDRIWWRNVEILARSSFV